VLETSTYLHHWLLLAAGILAVVMPHVYIYICICVYVYVYVWLTLPIHHANRYGERDSSLMLQLVLVTRSSAAWKSSPSGCAVPRPNTECVQKLLSEKADRMQCFGTAPGHGGTLYGLLAYAPRRPPTLYGSMAYTHTHTHNTHTHRLFQIDAHPDRVSLRFCSGLVLARTDSEQFCNTSLSMRARPDLESLVEVSVAPARHVCMYMHIYICMYTHRLFQIDAQPDRVSLRFCSGLVLARTDAEQFCNTSLAIRARPDLESLVEVSAAPARHVCMYMQHLGQSMFEIGRRQCWGPRCSQELARTCTQIPACPAPPEGGAAEHIYVYIHTYIHTYIEQKLSLGFRAQDNVTILFWVYVAQEHQQNNFGTALLWNSSGCIRRLCACRVLD
jgi:hypothetical protein